MTILKIKQPIQRMKFVIKELKAILYLPDELQERGYKAQKRAKYIPEENKANLVLKSSKENWVITFVFNFGANFNLQNCNELLGNNLNKEREYTPESELDIYSSIMPIWNGCYYTHTYRTGDSVSIITRYLEFYKEKMWVMICLDADFDNAEECLFALKHILDNAEIEIKD